MEAHLVLRVDGPFPRLVRRDETGFRRVRCVLVIALPPGGPPLPAAAASAQGRSTRPQHPATSRKSPARSGPCRAHCAGRARDLGTAPPGLRAVQRRWPVFSAG